jgi:hypothetical protein
MSIAQSNSTSFMTSMFAVVQAATGSTAVETGNTLLKRLGGHKWYGRYDGYHLAYYLRYVFRRCDVW